MNKKRRYSTLILLFCAIVSASILIKSKVENFMLAREIEELRTNIIHERNLISLLKARHEFLSSPNTIQKYVNKYKSQVDLYPIIPTQIISIEQLSLYKRPIEKQIDFIGEILKQEQYKLKTITTTNFSNTVLE